MNSPPGGPDLFRDESCTDVVSFGREMDQIVADVPANVTRERRVKVINHNTEWRERFGRGTVVLMNDRIGVVRVFVADRGCKRKDHIRRDLEQQACDAPETVCVLTDRGERSVPEEIAEIPVTVIPVDYIAAGDLLPVIKKRPQGVGGEPAVVFISENFKIRLQKLGNAAFVPEADRIAQ